MARNGFITAEEAASADPAEVRIQQSATNNNTVRYFTDWALPQLDTLIDQTTDPIDVWTTLDPRMQVAADKAVRANVPKGAQGALVSLDRDGRGQGLCLVDLQPCDSGRASARLGVQTVRLSLRPRIRDEADRHDRR